MRNHRAGAMAAAVSLTLAAAAAAQEPPPFVPNRWEFGRPAEAGVLRVCIDRREAGWEVDRDIAEAIAAALLLEPAVHVVESQMAIQSLDDLYALMLEHCFVHMGFKLLPGTYPAWFELTRAYYRADYVYVTANPDWTRLADLPGGSGIAATMGSRADLSLAGYLGTRSEGRRWVRYPIGTNELALQVAANGGAAAALVWRPVLWAERRHDPALAALRILDPAPLPVNSEGVGAVVLGGETFLRASIDEVIAALTADGTIAAILEAHDFPGRLADE